MTRLNFICVVIFAACCNAVLTAIDAGDDYQDQNVKERPVGRSYSLTTCDYKTQTGFTCLTCSRALHCYAGNIAIIVDCYGLFRYCRDGRCSRFQGEKCAGNKFTTQGPLNATTQTDTANVATTSEATTRIVTGVTESVAETVTETAIIPIPIDEKVTTNSDNTTATPVDEKITTKSESTTTVTPVDEKMTTKSGSTTIVTPVGEKMTTKNDSTTTDTPVDELMTTKSDSTTTVTPVDEKATTKSDVSSTTVIDISSNVV